MWETRLKNNNNKTKIRYSPLNALDIRLHYPIYKVIFHFVLTSLKTRTLPVKNTKQNKKRDEWKEKKLYRELKVTTTTLDKPCEKTFSTDKHFTHIPKSAENRLQWLFNGERYVKLNHRSCQQSKYAQWILLHHTKKFPIIIIHDLIFGHVTEFNEISQLKNNVFQFHLQIWQFEISFFSYSLENNKGFRSIVGFDGIKNLSKFFKMCQSWDQNNAALFILVTKICMLIVLIIICFSFCYVSFLSIFIPSLDCNWICFKNNNERAKKLRAI